MMLGHRAGYLLSWLAAARNEAPRATCDAISAAWLSSRADWELTGKIGMKYVPKIQGERDINVVDETAHIVNGGQT